VSSAGPPASPASGEEEFIAVVPGLLLPATGELVEPAAPGAGGQAPGAEAGRQEPGDGGPDGEITSPPAAPVAEPPVGDDQPTEPATG
jgi:hypothetical protein